MAISHSEILKRLDFEQRTVQSGRETIEVLPLVTRRRGLDGDWHMVSFSNLSADNADATILEEIRHHRELGVDFEWKLYLHDSPENLLERLEAHGFKPGPSEAFVVAEVDKIAEFTPHPSIRVKRVDSMEKLEDFRQVTFALGDKDQSSTLRELQLGIESGSTDHVGFVAYWEGEPASIGRVYYHPGTWFAGLYGGATLPKLRGRGLYRALVVARAADAAARGARLAQVDALPTSRPILERMGFQKVTETIPCDWSCATPQ